MGVPTLSRELLTCVSITAFVTLAISSSILGCGGSAREKAAVDQLRQLGALVVLDINKHASSLVLPNDGEKIQQAMPLLPRLRYLTSFSGINTPITDEALVTVGQLKSLTNVDLSGTGITNVGVSHLVGLSKLSSLNLASTKVTSNCLADVGKLKSIDILNLANTSLSGGFEHLAGCQDLSWLVLSELKLSDADAAAIAEHPNLKRLSAAAGVDFSEHAKNILLAKGIQLDYTAEPTRKNEP